MLHIDLLRTRHVAARDCGAGRVWRKRHDAACNACGGFWVGSQSDLFSSPWLESRYAARWYCDGHRSQAMAASNSNQTPFERATIAERLWSMWLPIHTSARGHGIEPIHHTETFATDVDHTTMHLEGMIYAWALHGTERGGIIEDSAHLPGTIVRFGEREYIGSVSCRRRQRTPID